MPQVERGQWSKLMGMRRESNGSARQSFRLTRSPFPLLYIADKAGSAVIGALAGTAALALAKVAGIF